MSCLYITVLSAALGSGIEPLWGSGRKVFLNADRLHNHSLHRTGKIGGGSLRSVKVNGASR